MSIIRNARKAAGMTQEELAQKIGVNRATLSKYESGQIIPNIAQCHKIAQALGTSIPELWGNIDGNFLLNSDVSKLVVSFKHALISVKGGEVEYLWGSHENASDFTNRAAHIVSCLDRLTAEGQRIALERVEELTQIPKYQATPTENPAGFEAGAQEGEKTGDLSTKQEKPPEGENKPNDGNT